MVATSFPSPASRLGYLLKHANARIEALNAAALRPLDLSTREVGVLLTIANGDPPSQQEAAARLGVDRTTMVAILDGLEAKGVVLRRPSADDRRRNVVQLTEDGERILRRAIRASDAAEQEFLRSLDAEGARRLAAALRAVVAADATWSGTSSA